MLSALIFMIIFHFWHMRTASFLWSYFEIVYILFAFKLKFIGCMFLYATLLLFWNSIFFIIEVYGILTRMTRFEIYHSERVKSLFTIIHDFRMKQLVNVRLNYIKDGIKANVLYYFKKAGANLSFIWIIY